jgi:hypothetical protein
MGFISGYVQDANLQKKRHIGYSKGFIVTERYKQQIKKAITRSLKIKHIKAEKNKRFANTLDIKDESIIKRLKNVIKLPTKEACHEAIMLKFELFGVEFRASFAKKQLFCQWCEGPISINSPVYLIQIPQKIRTPCTVLLVSNSRYLRIHPQCIGVILEKFNNQHGKEVPIV